MDDNLGDLIEEYRSVKKLHRLEGDTGVGNLNQILTALGYKEHGFKYGSPIEVFLSDNPGAIEAILEWIENEDHDEWKENIITHLPEKDDD